jgi:hypothetical protein
MPENIFRYLGNKELEIRFLSESVAAIHFRNTEGAKEVGATTNLGLLAHSLLDELACIQRSPVTEYFETMDLRLMWGSGALAGWVRNQGVSQGFTITHDDGLTVRAVRMHIPGQI